MAEYEISSEIKQLDSLFSGKKLTNTPDISHEYFNNTKVAKELALADTSENNTMEVSTLHKKNVFVTVEITADRNVSLSTNVSAFDMAVMDSIYSLTVNGYMQFTPELVARTMSGNFSQKITAQKKGAITKSIEKLRHITVRIDITEEMRARKKIKKDETLVLSSYLLPVKEAELSWRGGVIKCYGLMEKPALYDYAEMINQIISVPIKYLAIKTSASDTEEAILIKRYLLKRIELMKNDANNIRLKKISYIWWDKTNKEFRGMFPSIGIEHPESISRNKRSDLHKTTVGILDQFVKSGYIKGYSVNQTKINGGMRNDGITIDVAGSNANDNGRNS